MKGEKRVDAQSASQVRKYFPVSEVLGTRHRERQSAKPEGQCDLRSAPCVSREFQRLLSRGLGDHGHLFLLFHHPSPWGCLVSLKLK